MSEMVDDIDELGMEDAESEYFQNIDFSDPLEESNESMQGNLTPPTFAYGQSTSLQGSQGFQLICLPRTKDSVVMNPTSNVSDVKLTESDDGGLSEGNKLTLQALFLSHQNQITNTNPHPAHSAPLGLLNSTVQPAFNVTSSADNMTVFPNHLNAVILDLHGSNLNNTGKGESGRSVPREILPNPVMPNVAGAVKQEAASIHGDSGSSDEKSGKTKSSPKHRNKKGRSGSTSAIDLEVKNEPVDDSQETQTADCSPSLDEILTHKKMALMKSPEVIRFLRERQRTFIDRNTNRHSIADS